MKKWLALFMFTFILTACSDEGESQQTEQPVEKMSEEEQLRNLHYKQFNEVLAEAVDQVGYPMDGNNYEKNYYSQGVYYSELIDFNNDGVEELYVLMKNLGFSNSEYAHRNVVNYVHEVWTGAAEGDTPELAFSFEIPADECTACDLSVTLVEAEDGRTFLKQFSHQTRQGYLDNATNFYEIDAGTSTAYEFYETGSGQVRMYSLNGEEITTAEYDEQIAKFNGQERPIIISEAGMKSYGYTTKSAEQVSELLAKLSVNNNTVIGGEKVDAATEATVLEAFETDIIQANVDIRDLENRSSLVFATIMESDLAYIQDPETYALSYPLADVAVEYEKRYGVPLDMTGVNMPDRSQQMYEFITFENDTFYVTATDFNNDDIQRQFEAVYAVNDTTYYVELTDTTFDGMSYFGETMDERDLSTMSRDQWPPEAENYAKSNINRYAVVKMVDGEPKLQYLGYRNLTDDELAAF